MWPQNVNALDVLEVDHNLVLRMTADVYETAMNELSLNQKGVIQKKKKTFKELAVSVKLTV